MGWTRLQTASLVSDFWHTRGWSTYRAMAFEANSEEYPWEGISFLGGPKLRFENGMELVQRSRGTFRVGNGGWGHSLKRGHGSQSRAVPLFATRM